jgi:hypothetical protein
MLTTLEIIKKSQEDGSNVIVAHFGEEVYMDIFNRIKFQGGPHQIESALIKDGHHQSWVKAVVKKIMKERGW